MALSVAIASASNAFVADLDNKTVRASVLGFARAYLGLAP